MEQEEFDVGAGDETRYVVVEESVNTFQVPVSIHQRLQDERKATAPCLRMLCFSPLWTRGGTVHLSLCPLHLLGYI